MFGLIFFFPYKNLEIPGLLIEKETFSGLPQIYLVAS